MEIPPSLKNAIEEMASHRSLRSLSEKASVLSTNYRAPGSPAGLRLVPDGETAGAYSVYRMPATFAAVDAALESVSLCRPDWTPGSLLDAGAGPGTAAWAVAERWPSIGRIVLCEQERHMMATGRELAAHSPVPSLAGAEWRQADIRQADPADRFDLVVASYMIGELPPGDRMEAIDRLWSMTAGVLLLVEPGTPERFGILRRVRDRFTEREGCHILAPCPHANACPMTADDWCHFSRRLARISLQRQVKAGELPYEDEKFTYLALSRHPGLPYAARVLRHPVYGKKLLRLEYCTTDGLRTQTVTKGKDPESYRISRKLAWGDSVAELPGNPE